MPAGYQSVNTLSWAAVVDNNLNEINSACLELDPHMSRPHFSIKDRQVLLEEALQKASDDVKNKLNKECKLLGVSSDKLKIQNWNFGYEGYLPSINTSNYVYNSSGFTGAMGATGPQGSAGSVGPQGPIMMKLGSIYQELLDQKLEPGNITVKVAVRVNYIWND